MCAPIWTSVRVKVQTPNEVETFVKLTDLTVLIGPAINGNRLNATRLAKGARHLLNLFGEFARWRHDQRNWPIAMIELWLRKDVDEGG